MPPHDLAGVNVQPLFTAVLIKPSLGCVLDVVLVEP